MKYLLFIFILFVGCSEFDAEIIGTNTLSRQEAISKYGDWIEHCDVLAPQESFREVNVIIEPGGWSGICVDIYEDKSVGRWQTLTHDKRGYWFMISHDDYRNRTQIKEGVTDTLWVLGYKESVCDKGFYTFGK